MSELSERDILKNPGKFGFCSFEEYCKNPDKWRPVAKDQEQLGLIDNGGQNLRRILKERTFHVGFQTFKSLEKAQEFCRDHGIDVKNWKVIVEPIPGQWAHEKVIFMSPEEFERRSR